MIVRILDGHYQGQILPVILYTHWRENYYALVYIEGFNHDSTHLSQCGATADDEAVLYVHPGYTREEASNKAKMEDSCFRWFQGQLFETMQPEEIRNHMATTMLRSD